MKPSVKKIIPIVLFLALLVYGRYLSQNKTTILSDKIKKETPISVTVSKVENSTITPSLDIYGKIESTEKITIVSEVSGKLLNANKDFKVGHYFYKGEVLVIIDTTDLSLELMAYKSEFLSAITQSLPFIKMDYNDNYFSWEAYVNSFKMNHPLKSLPDYRSDKERNFLASKQIYKLFYSIRAMEEKLQKFIIRAPFDGIVSEVYISNNSIIVPGLQIGKFISSTNFTFTSSIDLSQSTLLNIGNKLKLYSEELDTYFIGKVSRIAKNIDPLTQKISFYVDVKSSKLYDGMYLNGTLQLNQVHEGLELERELLQDSLLMVVDSNFLIQFIPVKPVVFLNKTVIVTGFDINKYLVNQSSFNFKEGIKVHPIFE